MSYASTLSCCVPEEGHRTRFDCTLQSALLPSQFVWMTCFLKTFNWTKSLLSFNILTLSVSNKQKTQRYSEWIFQPVFARFWPTWNVTSTLMYEHTTAVFSEGKEYYQKIHWIPCCLFCSHSIIFWVKKLPLDPPQVRCYCQIF